MKLVWTRSKDDWKEDKAFLHRIDPAFESIPAIKTKYIAESKWGLDRIADVSCVILTSPKSAKIFSSSELGAKVLRHAPSIYVIGEKTRRMLPKDLRDKARMPKQHDINGLAAEFGAEMSNLKGTLLSPGAVVRAHQLCHLVDLTSCKYIEIPIYQTIPVEAHIEHIEPHSVICFASPSAVAGFLGRIDVLSSTLTAVVIGKTTHEAVRSQFGKIVVSDSHDLTSLAEKASSVLIHRDPMKPEQKTSIFSLSPAEIDHLFAQMKEPKFRAKQFREWLFEHREPYLDHMTNLSKKLRSLLIDRYDWELPKIVSRLDSDDGASKLLLKDRDGRSFEAVILRYDNRVSLCVSSQVGCKLSCSFCQTGKLGFFRNLDAGEIMGQFYLANFLLREEERRITHIVFMGMGEPLDNYENVRRTCNLLTGKDAIGISPRRVTVSTSGIADKITRLAEETDVSLAISLHACRDDLRTELMPINKKFNLTKLKESLVGYQKSTGDTITFEYILIKDKTCGDREAKELVRFCHGLKSKVNLIPFNPHPGLPYEKPSDSEIRKFQEYLAKRSIPAPVRYSKGSDVSGACGQLAAKTYDQLADVPTRARVLQDLDEDNPS